METGFLNFHDEEHISDFSLSLDHQHNLLGESQSSLVRMVDDFNYIESIGFDTNGTLWETEQELNGDLAILPVSGVAGVIPKMENIKEDFAKVLTDWQEHIGYLQASEIEEDIDMVNLDIGINSNLVNNVFDNTIKSTEKGTNNILMYEEPPKHSNNIICNSIKYNINCYKTAPMSLLDQSEKEIDVVGIDSVEDTKSIIEFMDSRRQHETNQFIRNSKTLGINGISNKPKSIDIVVKDEPLDIKHDMFPVISSHSDNSKFSNNNKKKHSKKYKVEILDKKSKKAIQISDKTCIKNLQKSNKNDQIKKFIEETSNFQSISSTSPKKPVLEAGDVKSLLEQFEATEATSISPHVLKATSKPIASKFSINKSQVSVVEKFIDSQNLKDIQNSLPKALTDRIQITDNLYTNGYIDELVHLDHDYCSNSNLLLSNCSVSCNKSSEFKDEYINKRSEDEQFILIKEKLCNQNDLWKKNTGEHAKYDNRKVAVAVRTIWMDTSSKKNTDIEFINNTNKEQSLSSNSTKCILQGMTTKESRKLNKTLSQVSLLDKNKILNKTNMTSSKPIYEMKIQSALATRILQLRKGVLTQTKSVDTPRLVQMVSVLKKPPALTIPQNKLKSNLKKSIVTTTNSLNDQVRNIIIEDTTDVQLFKDEKKPVRKKLNLAEYRSRREHLSDGSRTNFLVQPMILVYIHHASTNTEPINDGLDNIALSEREIVSVLKLKSEVEEQRFKPKQPSRDRGIQTSEMVFIFSFEKNKDGNQKKKHELDKQEQKQPIIKGITDEINVDKITLIKKEFIANMLKHEKIKNIQINNQKILKDDIKILNIDLINNEQKAAQTKSINCMRDQKHRTYRRTHIRSCFRSRNQNSSRDYTNQSLRRTASQNRSYAYSHSHSRSHSGSRSCNRNHSHNFKRSGTKNDDEDCNDIRSRSRSTDIYINRSRGRSKSCVRHHTRRRRISHRRSSVSSTSSWSSHSRSRSRSVTRSRSRSSMRCRFLSRSISRSRSRSRSRSSSSRSRSSRYSNCSRSPLSFYRRSYDEWCIKEKQRQVEERRVIYVGRLKDDITKTELRKRFETFGPVVNISLHFRERGHNYGFVTFAYKNDAYEAVEHGNDDPSLPRYDLCFGGRRAFCKVKYADLDGVANNSLGGNKGSMFKPEEENTFDLLLKEAQAKLRKRKV